MLISHCEDLAKAKDVAI